VLDPAWDDPMISVQEYGIYAVIYFDGLEDEAQRDRVATPNWKGHTCAFWILPKPD